MVVGWCSNVSAGRSRSCSRSHSQYTWSTHSRETGLSVFGVPPPRPLYTHTQSHACNAVAALPLSSHGKCRVLHGAEPVCAIFARASQTRYHCREVEACSGSCDWGELDALAVTHTTVETFAVESADDEDDASEDTEPDSASEDTEPASEPTMAPTPAPTMAPTPPNFAAFAESLLTAYDGDQQAAHTAFAALLGALDIANDTPTAEEPEAEEPKPDPEPEPTVPDPPLALAAVAATCTAVTKKKKRYRNQPKKGSTNGLCSVHQPDPEPASSSSEETSDDSQSSPGVPTVPIATPKESGVNVRSGNISSTQRTCGPTVPTARDVCPRKNISSAWTTVLTRAIPMTRCLSRRLLSPPPGRPSGPTSHFFPFFFSFFLLNTMYPLGT